jgi:uncharacterized protein DUF6941
MDKPRPYVTAALLCEKILQEKDESLTLVRIADRLQYSLEGQGLPEGTKPMITMHGLLGIKSGPITGDHTLTLVSEKPSGHRKQVLSLPVKLLGKDHAQNVILNIGLGIDENGLYWFDVLFDEELLTRIPLMVTPLQKQTPQEQKP